METLTSPPAPRMLPIIAAAVVSEETLVVPSQVGVHPPALGARMNASWNAFCPVAFMTATGSGGLLSNGIRYGAEGYQLLLRAALAGRALTMPTATAASATPAMDASVTSFLRCMGAASRS